MTDLQVPMKIGSCSADLLHLREVCGFGAIRRRKTADRRKRGLRYMNFIGWGAAATAWGTSRKIPSWEGWREATAVAKRRGGSSVGHKPLQS